MVAVMKEVYGEAAFNKHNVVNWEMAADRCNFAKMPEQGANECGFYALKVPRVFDGLKFVEKIVKKDVSCNLSIFSMPGNFYFCFLPCVNAFFCLYFICLSGELRIGRLSTCSNCCSIPRTQYRLHSGQLRCAICRYSSVLPPKRPSHHREDWNLIWYFWARRICTHS
jgi:hypothetical protein